MNIQQLEQLAQEVVEHLPGWEYVPPREGRQEGTLRGEEEAGYRPELRIDEGHPASRLSINFQFPGELYHHRPHDSGVKTSITVSAEKDASTIARDISRRLLPDATKYFRATVARANQAKQYRLNTLEAARQLGEATGLTFSEPRSNTEYPHAWSSGPVYGITVSGPDSVHFEAFTCTLEQAKTIVLAVRS